MAKNGTAGKPIKCRGNFVVYFEFFSVFELDYDVGFWFFMERFDFLSLYTLYIYMHVCLYIYIYNICDGRRRRGVFLTLKKWWYSCCGERSRGAFSDRGSDCGYS